jgi:ribose 5-phosphate isomerase A
MSTTVGTSADTLKQRAAEYALKLVEPQMKLGLGTGSTASTFVALLGQRVAQGLDVVCVATSRATEDQARSLGIELADIDELGELDLTVDGADEIDGALRLIKGGGGALLREKIVAMASDRVVIIADHSKRVDTLGHFKLPVEITPFGAHTTIRMMQVMAEQARCEGEIRLREGAGGAAFITEGGNLIADCAFGQIDDPELLAEMLSLLPGVVEHGLFIGIADMAVIAGPDGLSVLEAAEEIDEG